MPNKSSNQITGIILVIAAAFLYINIPFLEEKSIAALAVLGCGIYLLIKK